MKRGCKILKLNNFKQFSDAWTVCICFLFVWLMIGSYFTISIHFTWFTVGGSAGLRGASEASLHTTVPGFEREDVSWSNRFKKSLAMDMEHDRHDIVQVPSIYLHTFTILFSHVFVFFQIGLRFLWAQLRCHCVLCAHHIQGQVSREASRAVSRMSSRLSVKFSGFKVQKLGKWWMISNDVQQLQWNGFLRMERSRFGESKRPCRRTKVMEQRFMGPFESSRKW